MINDVIICIPLNQWINKYRALVYQGNHSLPILIETYLMPFQGDFHLFFHFQNLKIKLFIELHLKKIIFEEYKFFSIFSNCLKFSIFSLIFKIPF